MVKENAHILIWFPYLTYMNKLYKLYKKEEYYKILEYFEKNNNFTRDSILYLGIVLFEIGYPNQAMKYFYLSDETYYPLDIINKRNILIGLYYYSKGCYKKAKNMFNISNDGGKEWMKLLNLDNNLRFYKTNIYKSSSLNFYFDDSILDYQKDQFVIRYNLSYEVIYNFYKPNFPKSIDIFVYNNNVDAIFNKLSYSNSFLYTIHTNLFNECGHELAHLAVASLQKDRKFINKFINEGIAEVFNKTIYNNKFIISNLNTVIDLCDNTNNMKDIEILFVGKIFFTYLYYYGNKNQFIKISREQSRDNLVGTYGDLLFEAEEYTLNYIEKRNYKIIGDKRDEYL